MPILDSPAPPSTLDIRLTMASGRVIGLTYMHDGFAPTVPCTHKDCWMPANALLYELGTQGRLYRFCNEHMPKSVLLFVKSTLEGMRGLSDDPEAQGTERSGAAGAQPARVGKPASGD